MQTFGHYHRHHHFLVQAKLVHEANQKDRKDYIKTLAKKNI